MNPSTQYFIIENTLHNGFLTKTLMIKGVLILFEFPMISIAGAKSSSDLPLSMLPFNNHLVTLFFILQADVSLIKAM